MPSIPNHCKILKYLVCIKVAREIVPRFATSKGFISLFFSNLHTTRWLKICHLESLVRWLFYEDVVHFTLCTTNAIKKYHNNGYTS